MYLLRSGIVSLVILSLFAISISGGEFDKPENVRSGMTIAGAILGLAIGIPACMDLTPTETPLSDALLLAIPTIATLTTTGAVAGRWIANRTLAGEPSLLFSPIVGAGLGVIAGAVTGGISFALAIGIAIPVVDLDVGTFNHIEAIGMGFLAGAVWGGGNRWDPRRRRLCTASIPVHGLLVASC